MQQPSPVNNDFIKLLLAKGAVSKDVKDYSNEPFFIKKAEAAKKRLEKVGFPKAFVAKK
jgi:hypothetical protein